MFKKSFFYILFVALFFVAFFFYRKPKEMTLISINDQKQYTISKDKITVLFFWHPNCGACVYNLRNISSLKHLVDSFNGDMFFVIESDDYQKVGGARSVFVRFDLDYDIVFDHSVLVKKYNINVSPTMLVLYKDKVIFKKIGFVDWNDSEQIDNLAEQLKKYV